MFYAHCFGCGGCCFNWAALVRNNLPADPTLRWNATRLLLASLHMLYYTLNESEEDDGASISDKEWAMILSRGLLSRSEIATLTSYPGDKSFLPLIWAIDEVETSLAPEGVDGQSHGDAMLSTQFRSLAFEFRGCANRPRSPQHDCEPPIGLILMHQSPHFHCHQTQCRHLQLAQAARSISLLSLPQSSPRWHDDYGGTPYVSPSLPT